VLRNEFLEQISLQECISGAGRRLILTTSETIPYQGCKIQNGYYIPNVYKIYKSALKYIYQMAGKLTKLPKNIYQHLQWQDPPKFTKIGIFGLKIWQPSCICRQRKLCYDLLTSQHCLDAQKFCKIRKHEYFNPTVSFFLTCVDRYLCNT
jgi:hypothetical protein